MFAVLLGPDGSGKSSVMEQMRSQIPSWYSISHNPEHLYPAPDAPWYNWILANHPRNYFHSMKPLERAAFINSALAAEYERHIAPSLEAGMDVLCDSYWYRFVAKEELRSGASASIIRSMADELPVPDLIVRLEIAPEIAWERKAGVTTPFERFDDGDEKTAFVRFQERVSSRLSELTHGIESAAVDATSSRDIVFARVQHALGSAPQPASQPNPFVVHEKG